MSNKIKFTHTTLMMAIGFEIILLSFLSITRVPSQPQSATTVAPMPSSSLSSSTDSSLDLENECSPSFEQTVVQWLDMYWYPCELSWNVICIWPPFRRRHITYKVTVNDGIPLRDEYNRPIVIAKEKIRDWKVFDATAWNEIPDSPVHFARYPDYEPVASNEYVVLVETRYRWFNDVESTLRICVQQP